MNHVHTGHPRSFALIGHSGDGKTSLGDSLLHVAGATREHGRVEDGSSVLNFQPEENDGHHTHSITSHLYGFDWHGHRFTLIDTPGDPNFQGDGELVLQAVDGAVLVVDAVDGVKAGTARMLQLAEANHVPVVAFLNGLDRERADLETALSSLGRLDRKPILLSLPVAEEEGLAGVVDLLDLRWHGVAEAAGPVSDEATETARRLHESCVEAVAEQDDELLERYLETGSLSREDVVRGLARGVRDRSILPVVCGSAQAELGVDLMLREVEELLPSAEDHEAWMARRVDDEAPLDVRSDPDAPFSAVVFKTILDRYAGTLSVIRVVSGRLRPDSMALDATRGHRVRIGKLIRLQGERQVEVESAGPGDVVAIGKMKDVHTGDVLTCEKHGIHLPELEIPQGVIRYAIRAAGRSDEDKALAGLTRLAEEDAALRIEREPSTGEFLITGRGELHVRTTIQRLERLFGVHVDLDRPQVPYRETVRRPVRRMEGKLKKQTGGAGMFGVCYLDLEPMPRGTGVVFEDRIAGGAIPRGLVPAVEKGVREACETGPLAGFPVVDVKVVCVDGKHHPVDSNELAFKLAGSYAFQAAARAARPVLLEPFMHVEVTIPVERVGDVMGDLASRRGSVQGSETLGPEARIRAIVPMAEMLEYANVLTGLTGGKGEFHMELSHYDPLGPKLANRVMEEARKRSSGQRAGR